MLDPLVYLPKECCFKIFSYLNLQELGRCSQVNESWRRMATDNHLWKKYFPVITIPFDVDFKVNIDTYVQKYFERHLIIKSKKELEKQIQKFVSRVSLKKMGTFTAIPAGVLNHKNKYLPQSPQRSQRGFKQFLCDLCLDFRFFYF